MASSKTLASDGDPDQALVSRAKAGSTAAFDQLVRLHQGPVRAFLRRILSDTSGADDVAQETFIKAWQNIKRHNGKFRSWLFSIAANTAKDAWRSGNRAIARDTKWQGERDGAPDPEASVGAKLDLNRVLQALSPDQRLVVALCFGAGMSHSEAATTLNMPLGTVKSHAARGRDRALELMKDLNSASQPSIMASDRIAS